MTPEVIDLRASDTHDLRLRVLRAGTPSREVTFDGDELPTTFHLGARCCGEIVAISSWVERPYPDRADRDGYQLRGMATDPTHRGSGLGALLLGAGIDRVRDLGAHLVWARARDAALDFYERNGFAIVGAGYVDLTTGLPHHDVLREFR